MKFRRTANEKSAWYLSAGKVTLFIMFLLFVAARIITAWMMRNEVNGDLAIVQMMVRDMVTSFSVPAFFYGQAYMGSLEPIVNAITHIVFGHSNFGTALGTSLFFMLMAISVVRMARRAGTDWTAVAALAFCVIGPLAFMHYAVSPRGGYGILLFVTAALLDTGCVLICEMRENSICRKRTCTMLGFLVGIGFWCNQLIFPAAAAVAICTVILTPRILARPSFWFCTIFAFFFGSLPFWTWNTQNGWESFQMAGSLSFDIPGIARNLYLLFVDRGPSLFGINVNLPSHVTTLTALIATFTLTAPAWLIFAPPPRHIRNDEQPPRAITEAAKVQMILLGTYMVFFVISFVCSHFATFPTPRYLLPAVPVMAVFAGTACTLPRFKVIRYSAIAALLFTVVWQIRQIPDLFQRAKQDSQLTLRFNEAANFLEDKGIDAAYCSFVRNSLNLAGNGTVAFSDSKLERIPSFRRRLEITDSPAIVDDHQGFTSWALTSGATATISKAAGIRIATDIRPPAPGVLELPADKIHSIYSESGTDLLPIVTDRNFTTQYCLQNNGDVITVEFDTPEKVTGIRIAATDHPFIRSCLIRGLQTNRTDFAKLARSAAEGTMCVWSGPRFYPEQNCPFREIRFKPVQLSALQIHLRTFDVNGAIQEIQILSPSPDDPDCLKRPSLAEWNSELDSLIDILHRQGVRRLYAGRWIANNIHERTNGTIETNYGNDLLPKATGYPKPQNPRKPLELDAQTAVLASRSGTPSAREAFTVRGLKMHEIEVNFLGTLFLPSSNQTAPFGKGIPTDIDFNPDCTMLIPSDEWAESYLKMVPEPVTYDFLADLYQRNPDSLPILRKMLTLPIPDNLQLSILDSITRLSSPSLGSDAVFGDEFTWHGARIMNAENEFTPGGCLKMRHFWSTSYVGKAKAPEYRVFIHFIGPNSYLFQDDFDLASTSFYFDSQLADDKQVTWCTDRHIRIPNDAPPGMYEMHIGIYSRTFASHRLNISTCQPTHRNGAVIDPVFVIRPLTQNSQVLNYE